MGTIEQYRNSITYKDRYKLIIHIYEIICNKGEAIQKL